SKAVNSYFGTFYHRPIYYLGKDFGTDWTNFWSGRVYKTYDQGTRYSAPSAAEPNNSLGMLMSWSGFKLGVEALDTVNPFAQEGRALESGHRSFEQANYRSGFYFEGDPLGNAFGGETRSYTTYAEFQRDRWSSRSWFYFGNRPFRDVLEDWQIDHPGKTPITNRFVGIQEVLAYRATPSQEWRLGVELQRQKAFRNAGGDDRNDVVGFLAWNWTVGR
ncbi:MAG: hypothetical protein ACREP9_08380, partial [Candidatus Dormibacteraceae bacterium]